MAKTQKPTEKEINDALRVAAVDLGLNLQELKRLVRGESEDSENVTKSVTSRPLKTSERFL